MNEGAPPYQEHITADPQILVGKPTVRGTRISVELVFERLSLNPDLAELFAGYPELTVEDVTACFAYAAPRIATRWVNSHREVQGHA